MSHEFESGAFRRPAWHKLGNVVDRLMTVKEALVEGGLDWLVEKRPLFVQHPVTGEMEPSGIYANYRLSDGARLSDGLSEEYGVIQNADAFMLFDAIIDEGAAKISATTALYGGKVITLTAELNRAVRTPEGVSEIVPYLNLASSHDGSYALTIMPCDVEVVCANTLRLSFSKERFPRVTVRHVGETDKKVDEIREAVGLADAYYDEMEAEIERLVNQSVGPVAVEGILKKVFPAKNESDLNKNALGVRGLLETAPYIVPFKETGWGLLNAVNEWELWARPQREDTDRAESQARALLSSKGLPLTDATHKALVAARI